MGYCIYKICSNNIDYVYVGSTQNFTKRKYRHKSCCNNENGKHKNFKLYKTIRDNGNWENWRMVCIEELGDVSKRHAEIQEERWRVELNANLNSQKCYTTEEEKKEYYDKNRDKVLEQQKEYKKQNRDKIAEYKKEYYKNNKEQLAEQQKEYKKQNRDKLLEYTKEYNKNNKEKINEKITCECGGKFTKCNLSKHKKTKKHQAWDWRQTCLSA